VIELGNRVLMPGLIEPHGYPTSRAILLSGDDGDIRLVTIFAVSRRVPRRRRNSSVQLH